MSLSSVLTRGAERITVIVATPWTAIVFAALSLVSLPAVIALHSVVADIQWLGSVFLQLVLLPVIMIGQNVQGARVEQIIRETHDEVAEALTDIRVLVAATHREVTQD